MLAHFDDDDLIVIGTAVRELISLGVRTSEITEFIEAPSTDAEAPAARVQCSIRGMKFELVKSGFSGDLNLETQLEVFRDDLPTAIDGPNDKAIRNIIAWLIEHAPTKMAIQRSYGQLSTDPQPFQMPYWPQREAVGGTLHVYVPLFLVDEDPRSVYIWAENPDDYAQLGGYFHTRHFVDTPLLRVPEVLSKVIVFLEQAQQQIQVPSGASWSLVHGYLDKDERS